MKQTKILRPIHQEVLVTITGGGREGGKIESNSANWQNSQYVSSAAAATIISPPKMQPKTASVDQQWWNNPSNNTSTKDYDECYYDFYSSSIKNNWNDCITNYNGKQINLSEQSYILLKSSCSQLADTQSNAIFTFPDGVSRIYSDKWKLEHVKTGKIYKSENWWLTFPTWNHIDFENDEFIYLNNDGSIANNCLPTSQGWYIPDEYYPQELLQRIQKSNP